MIARLLRHLGLAVVEADRLSGLELIEELYTRHVADTVKARATLGDPADILYRCRRLAIDLRLAREVNAKQHNEIIRLRHLAMALEEENALLAPAAGEQLVTDIGRMLSGGGE